MSLENTLEDILLELAEENEWGLKTPRPNLSDGGSPGSHSRHGRRQRIDD